MLYVIRFQRGSDKDVWNLVAGDTAYQASLIVLNVNWNNDLNICSIWRTTGNLQRTTQFRRKNKRIRKAKSYTVILDFRKKTFVKQLLVGLKHEL